MVEGSLPQWLPLIALVTGDPTHLALLKEALPDPGAARTGSSNPAFDSQTIAAHACVAVMEQDDETADSWMRQLGEVQLAPHMMVLVPSLLAIAGDHRRALSDFQTRITDLERLNLWFGAGLAHFLFAEFAEKIFRCSVDDDHRESSSEQASSFRATALQGCKTRLMPWDLASTIPSCHQVYRPEKLRYFPSWQRGYRFNR